MSDLPITEKKCPECAETVKAEAKVCRFCGHRWHQPSDLRSTPPPPVTKPISATSGGAGTCPSCTSSQVQKVSVLIEAGTQSASFVGSAMNWSQGTGFGATSYSTKATSQTALASKFRLRRRPSNGRDVYGAGIAMLVIGAAFGFGSISNDAAALMLGMTVFFVAAGLLCLWIFNTSKGQRLRDMEAWERERDYIATAWFCHQCGHDWSPDSPMYPDDQNDR